VGNGVWRGGGGGRAGKSFMAKWSCATVGQPCLHHGEDKLCHSWLWGESMAPACHLTLKPFSLMSQLLQGCVCPVMTYKQSQTNCWLLQRDRDAQPLVGLHSLQGR